MKGKSTIAVVACFTLLVLCSFAYAISEKPATLVIDTKICDTISFIY